MNYLNICQQKLFKVHELAFFIFRGILLVGILPRGILLGGILLWRHFAGRDFPVEGFCERLFHVEGFLAGGILQPSHQIYQA